jgi:prephenate dehydrogenase
MAVKITIIGMDALGQSLALALRNSSSDLTIVGHDRKRNLMSEAQKAGTVDSMEWNLIRAIDDAKLIVINEPIHQIRETLELIGKEVESEAVITDTCPYKRIVIEWANSLLPDHLHFIGSTPLVQTEKLNARLFQEQRYAVIPQPDTPEAALRLLSDAIGLTGAKLLFMEVTEHDSLMAAVMQLPILTGAALLKLTSQGNAWREMALMAGSPYDQATKLPTSDPEALMALLHHSREPLLQWLNALQRELNRLKEELAQDDDGKSLEAYFSSLIEARQRWERERQTVSTENELAQQLDEVGNNVSLFQRLFGFGERGQ